MDQRQTFGDAHELFSFIEAISKDAAKVSLLIDDHGVERLEGIITAITQNDDMNKTFITVDSNREVSLSNIIAVNGLFRSDYSEC